MKDLIGSKINNPNTLTEEKQSENKEDDQNLIGSENDAVELCPDCHGSGSLQNNTCSSCNGKGVI